MQRFALAALLLAAVGCDAGADVAADPGRFIADLSGARSASVEGEASFPMSPCGGDFTFESASGTLYVSKECFENGDRAREKRYAIDTEYRRDGFQAWFIASDGTRYTGVDGTIDFVDVERDRIEGRFHIEAKPVGAEGQADESAAELTITGEFNADGYQPPLLYD